MKREGFLENVIPGLTPEGRVDVNKEKWEESVPSRANWGRLRRSESEGVKNGHCHLNRPMGVWRLQVHEAGEG